MGSAATLLVRLALGACLAAGLATAALGAGTWKVHLADGRVIESKRKPVSAFGQFRYWDETGRTVILPPEKVDLEKTRKANAGKKVQESAFIVTGNAAPSAPAASTAPSGAVLYSATWCPHCTRAKAWLAANGVPYRLVEVDRLTRSQAAEARARMQAAGSRSYPTLVVNGKTIRGFNPSAYTKAFGRAGR